MSDGVETHLKQLLAERPHFHREDGRDVSSFATPGTLQLLAAELRPGQVTIETGCGASTVVFAAAGTIHTAISPSPEEHRRVRVYCEEHGIEHSHVQFVEGPSDAVLPGMDGIEFDCALIDGAHSFPYPIVDWHFLRTRLRTGATLVVDDVPVPAVGVLFRHLARDPAWKLRGIVDNRTALFRKVRDEPPEDAWSSQPFNLRYPDYTFLPLARRLPVLARRYDHELRRRVGTRFPSLKTLYTRVVGR